MTSGTTGNSFLEELSRNLDTFVPWDEGNRDALRAIRELLLQGESARARDNFEPGHLTASSVVMSQSGERMLLIRHKKLGLWLQPGGHIEVADESIVKAASRELLEETGLGSFELVDPLFGLDVHTIPPFANSPGHLHFDVRVLYRAVVEDVSRTDEVENVGWFSLHEVATSSGDLSDGARTDRSVRALAARLLGRKNGA